MSTPKHKCMHTRMHARIHYLIFVFFLIGNHSRLLLKGLILLFPFLLSLLLDFFQLSKFQCQKAVVIGETKIHHLEGGVAR